MKSFLQFLQRAFKYFRNTKRVWRRPPRASLLIIDRGTASPLDEMFAHHNPHIMEIRGESVNMFALLRALPKIHLGAVAYLEAYIDFVKPKLILSRTDNNHTLWQLKRRPNVTYKVALIQNGWRLNNAQSLSSLNGLADYQVDNAFVFSEASRSVFSLVLDATFNECGSLRANNYERLTLKNNVNCVALISSFRESKSENYFSATASLGVFANVLSSRKLFLDIAGSESTEMGHTAEKKFYLASLTGCDWKIAKRISSFSSYDLVRETECVIVESSSLGYECLGMGMRVGFIAFRPQHRQDRRFGKPLEFGEKGPFWTNDPSEEEIGRILDYLLSVSDEQWERDSGWIRDQLMVHDYGNTKIRAYVEGVLTDSLESK